MASISQSGTIAIAEITMVEKEDCFRETEGLMISQHTMK
jgi:hypothetical protein